MKSSNHTCSSCGYSWKPKGVKPSQCPICGSRNIDKSDFQRDFGIDNVE